MNRNPKGFEMINTCKGNYGIRFEVQKKECGEIMYLE